MLSRVLFRVLRIISRLPLGGVRVLCRVLSRVFRVLRIMFAIGRCEGAVQGGVQGCC